MSSIKGQSTYDNTRHLNYISTAPYGDNIFTYTTSVNSSLATVGQIQSLLNLGTVTAGVGGTAPAGRILRTNGRKLFPGANPCTSIITTAGGTAVVTQLYSQMVGVIDVVSGLSGFIDPNDSLFAIYNVDKAIDYPNDGSTPAHLAHKGPSLYTAGNVSAAGGVGVGPVASVAAQVAGTITSDGAITANGLITGNLGLTIPLGDLRVTTGKVYLTTTAGAATVGTLTLNGTTPVVVACTGVTAASRIFLSRSGVLTNAGFVSVTATSTGVSFSVTSSNASDAGTLNYLVVN